MRELSARDHNRIMMMIINGATYDQCKGNMDEAEREYFKESEAWYKKTKEEMGDTPFVVQMEELEWE